MQKKRNCYFELIVSQMSYCVSAARLLRETLCGLEINGIEPYRQKMHELERSADKAQRELLVKLSNEFITPIDREDIVRLVQLIDDITDALDEVTLDIYMYHITSAPDGAVRLSDAVGSCVEALYEAVSALHGFKKPEPLNRLIARVSELESEADGIYSEAVHGLFASEPDTRALIGIKAVYEELESCCDLCEHAADVIAQVIIKNT